MPIFEYACQECEHVFEALVLADKEEPAVCPSCGRNHIARVMSPGSFRPHGIPKGSGGFKPPACAARRGK